jgi:hypothetical protein
VTLPVLLVGAAAVGVVLLAGPAHGQRDAALDVIVDIPPVPLGKITRRAPYQQPAQPAADALPADWRPIVRPAADPAPVPALARLRYVHLPGTIACSYDPAGREVCGPGYWFADDGR